MGKQGPCYHCGVTSTPLWRNGPPEKPILCNACGSRWRTKGSLANYTPLHARAEHDDFEIFKIPKVKKISIKRKEGKLLKRKQSLGNVEVEGEGPDPDRYFSKFLDEDTSNRSSSGSAVSYSESCAQFSGNDASDLTGSAQSIMGDTLVPSRKRTCMNHPKPSHVEKLTRDLHSILHEQQSSSSYFSGSSEEDLLFESGTPMVSVEIGHGSILIRHPNMVAREEESEASSLSVDNKPCPINEAYLGDASLPVHIDNWGVSFQSTGPEKVTMPMGHGTYEEQTKRDKLQHDELQILRNHNSPLRSVDLKEIICFEEFVEHMTHEEQLKLMKYLPSIDATLPDSLKGMFDSLQFAENISSFQKLLAEGVFDFSVSGISSEECKALKRLALVNLTKSKWVENYNLLKEVKHKHIKGGKGIESGSRFPWSSNLVPVKRPRDIQNQNLPEPKAMMKSPKRFLMKANYDVKDLIDNDASYFSPKSLFSLPPDDNSFMLDPFLFTHDNSDQDLLFDVPSNGSFPEAELLNFSSSIGTQQASTSSSTVYPHLVHL